MIRVQSLLGLAVVVAGCVDSEIGANPLDDPNRSAALPYLPVGLARVPAFTTTSAPSGSDLLLVANSNFDQRYNAGTVTAYLLSELSRMIPTDSSTVAYLENLDPTDGGPAPFVGAVRTNGAAGLLSVLRFDPNPDDDDPEIRSFLALPTRFQQTLTLLEVRTDRVGVNFGMDPRALPPQVIGSTPLACRFAADASECFGRPCESSNDVDRVGTTDCSETFTLPLVKSDPYMVAQLTDGDVTRNLAVTHLSVDPFSFTVGVISFIEACELQDRFRGLRTSDFLVLSGPSRPQTSCPEHPSELFPGIEPPANPLPRDCRLETGFRLNSDPNQAEFCGAAIRGLDSSSTVVPVQSLARSEAGEEPGPGFIVTTNRDLGGELNAVGVTEDTLILAPAFQPSDEPNRTETFIAPEVGVDFSGVTAGFTTRGSVYVEADEAAGTAGRLYTTIQIRQQVDSNTSAFVISSYDPETEEFEVRNVFALGEELGGVLLSPFAPPNRRWVYVLDARGDQIFLLDVTQDRPSLLFTLRGRGQRDLPDGGPTDRTIVTFLLASPMQAVFDERDGRRLMYISNFENSTIAVFDVTDPNPVRHRIVARVGRDLNAAGTRESYDNFFRPDR